MSTKPTTHKFEYVLSGIELTDKQHATIAAAIAKAVTETVIATPESRISKLIGSLKMDRPNGGMLALIKDQASLVDAFKKEEERRRTLPAM